MNIYRNESLIQMETYETDPQRADSLVGQIRAKWAFLRERGYAGDYPVEILRNGADGGPGVKIVEVFKWLSQQARMDAQKDEEYGELERRITSLTTTDAAKESFTQAVRGFNSNFPGLGGVELLK